MRTILGIMAALACALPAQAQSRYEDEIGYRLDRRCTTQACFDVSADIDSGVYGREAVTHPQPTNRYAVNACVEANIRIGRAISYGASYAIKRQINNGGRMTYDDVSYVRSLLFTETYYVRQALRDIIAMGDVTQCNRLRDRGIEIVHGIVRENTY